MDFENHRKLWPSSERWFENPDNKTKTYKEKVSNDNLKKKQID